MESALREKYGVTREKQNYDKIDIRKTQNQDNGYLKTKKILREFSALNGNYISAEEMYAFSLSHNSKEDIELVYEHISCSHSAECIYKFANFFADDLSLSQMRELYRELVDMGNEIYISKFIKDVLPKINAKDYSDEERYC